MPFLDEDGDIVDKGDTQFATRTVSIDAGASATVTFAPLINVQNAYALLIDNGDGSDGVNAVDPSVGDPNQVEVTLATSGSTNTDLSVEVVAEGL